MTFDIQRMRSEEGELLEFQACFTRNNSPKKIELLKWQYLENPCGNPVVIFAKDQVGDERAAAGIYAVFPVDVWLLGGIAKAVQSLDTLTDKDYRGRGVFPLLASAVYDACREEDVAFVYGFPNGNSAPGFFGKLRWTKLDPVPFLIRPLRLRYFLRRAPVLKYLAAIVPNLPIWRPGKPDLPADVRLTTELTFGPETDDIWRRFRSEQDVAIDRNSRYMEWRFSKKPLEKYQLLGCRDSSGRLLAFCVYTVKHKHGGYIGYIMELLHDPACHSAASACLQGAIRSIYDSGADAILAWCLPHSKNFSVYTQERFLDLPERFRPIELHFGVRSFRDEASPTLVRRENWYISYCDSDTV